MPYSDYEKRLEVQRQLNRRWAGTAKASWKNMKSRVTNPNASDYKNYGGRGIKIAERWICSTCFPNFLEDMGERPEGKTLDRIDVNGNYEPGNCRWADYKTQRVNQR